MKIRSFTVTIYLIIGIIIFQTIPIAEAMHVSVRAIKARESEEYSPQTARELGFSGKGINVAVIDSGVDDEHPDLEGKFIAGVDLTHEESREYPRDGSYNPDDADGHGTHCAGLVMGTGNESGGVHISPAPDSKLVDIKILTGKELGTIYDKMTLSSYERHIESLEWIQEHKEEFNIRIISCSISSVGDNSNGGDPVSPIVNDAVDSGLVVIVPAGNEGPNNQGFQGLSAADGAITVGNSDDRDTVSIDDDIISRTSCRGPRNDDGDDDPFDELKPDIVAPGQNVTSPRYSNINQSLGLYESSSGSSFSAPAVAGVVALMLEANPGLTPEHVKRILHLTATQKGTATNPEIHPKWNREWGYGLIDAYNAVKLSLQTDVKIIDPYQIVYISSIDENTVMTQPTIIKGKAFYQQGQIENIEVKVDNDRWERTTFNNSNDWYYWSYYLDTEQFENGEHTISVRSSSQIGYSFNYSITVNLDDKEEEDIATGDTNKEEENPDDVKIDDPNPDEEDQYYDYPENINENEADQDDDSNASTTHFNTDDTSTSRFDIGSLYFFIGFIILFLLLIILFILFWNNRNKELFHR